MPWDMDNVPNPAKNKSPKMQQVCIRAANSVLAENGTEEDAIYACLGAMKNVEASLELSGALQVEAAQDGSVLYFKNAVLCRAETNGNMDRIDEEGVAQVAATLALKPIDVEHQKQQIAGSFTQARPEGMAVSTDGYLWPDRYPEETNAVRAGSMFLSVEALPEYVICDTCKGEFVTASDYCEHLTAPLNERRRKGWSRWAKNLVSAGGALTRRPAGTATQFDRRSIYMLASLADPDQELIERMDAVLRKYGLRILEA